MVVWCVEARGVGSWSSFEELVEIEGDGWEEGDNGGGGVVDMF